MHLWYFGGKIDVVVGTRSSATAKRQGVIRAHFLTLCAL